MSNAQTAVAALGALVDELGDIELEILPFRAKTARAEALRAALRAHYKDASPADGYQIHGTRWSTYLGPCGNASAVDVLALFKLVGPEKFLTVAGVTVKAIAEKCGADVVGAVVSVSATGSRPLSITPKAPEPPKPPRKNARKSNV